MDHRKKKRIKRYILWFLLIATVVGLAVMPLLAVPKAEEDGPQATVLTATVQDGSIEVSLKGGGTLTAGEAMDVTVPSGVKITEFLVSNGEIVEKDTPVAKVDPVSVMNAILQVRETMDYLQEQISSAREDTVENTIRAAAGGRIKQVFAKSGDSVQDVMLRDGALAVLSLDGLMAVRLERKTELCAADSVCVTLANGTEVPGRVESYLNGILVVTVEDEGYAVGETVTVATEEGDRIGNGVLYVHNAWKAVGFSGTVKTVQAKVEKTVSDGSVLFTLTDTDFTGNLETLSNLHREYEKLLQKLFRMYETQELTAPCDGMVSGVDENSSFLLSASAEDSGWKSLLLSGNSEPVCTGKDSTGTTCQAKDHVKGCYFYCTGTANCTAKPGTHKITCLTWCISAGESGICKALNHKTNCIEKCELAAQTDQCPADTVHKPGCIESCISTDGSIDCPAAVIHKPQCLERCDKSENCTASAHHYDTCLTFCTGDADCPALNHKESCYMAQLKYYAYAALVKQTGTAELIVAADTQTRYEIRPGETGWQLVEPTVLRTDLMITEQTVAVDNPEQFKAGDAVLFWTGYSGETPVKTGTAKYSAALPSEPGDNGQTGSRPGGTGFGGMSGMGIMSGMMGGMSSGSGGQSQTPELYERKEQTLLTVIQQSTMTLTVTLDQQDIAKAKLGQNSQVKVTALKGQVFEAEVSWIGAEGTNNGGSSKFSLELTLPYADNMLAGMNATAIIPLYTKMDVLTLPAAALAETEKGTVVYTAVDSETGELFNPVPVTTGASDGETVEILSGLNKGDTVYYTYYNTLELDHTAKAEQGFGFR